METLQQKINAIHRSEYTNCGCHNRSIHRDIEEINKALQEFREQIIRERQLDIESKKANENTVLYDFRIKAYNKVLALIGEQTNA